MIQAGVGLSTHKDTHSAALEATQTALSGAGIDTADFAMGVMFACMLQAFTDGVYAFAVSESDDPAMAGATVVGAEKIIESLPILDTAITALGDKWKVFGVHSTKRYLQITVTSTGVSTGAQVVVAAIMKGETSPQSRA